MTNGDLWRVRHVHPDGSLTLSGTTHRGTLIVPADYTRTHVELGYAATVHRAQGMTVDRAHLLAGDTLTRAGVYVGLTRGRESNHLYVITEDEPGASTADTVEAHHHGGLTEDTPRDPREVFARIVARGDDNLAATEVLAGELDHADDTTRLRAMHADRVTTLATDRAGYLLYRAMPAAQHTEITASGHYRDLVATLVAAQAHGLKTTALVTAITDPRTTDPRTTDPGTADPDLVVDPLTGARDPVAVLRSRADRWIADHTPDRDAVSVGDTRPGGFRALRDLPTPEATVLTPARHPGMDTDLADHADRLARRIHRLQDAAVQLEGAEHAATLAEVRDDPMRCQHSSDLDRRLVGLRSQYGDLALVGMDNDETRRLRRLIALGEQERTRRTALTPQQHGAESRVRRELDGATRPTTDTLVAGEDPAELTRRRAAQSQRREQAHGVGREV